MTKKTIKLSKLSNQDFLKTLTALLKAKPTILESHPELLEYLEFGDPRSGNITSLASRQSAQLKSQLEELRQNIQVLVKNAHHYDVLTSNIYKIINELIACEEVQIATNIIVNNCPALFNIDFVHIHSKLVTSDPLNSFTKFDPNCINNEAYTHVIERISQGKVLCGDRFPESVLTYFFGDNSTKVKSVAFIPLIGKHTEMLGVLSFGSINNDKFSSKLKGTIHLERLGKATALTIERICK